jgi:hypothetical protein
VFIAGLGDANFFLHGSAGRILARIETGGSDPLADVQVGGQQEEFGQKAQVVANPGMESSNWKRRLSSGSSTRKSRAARVRRSMARCWV